MAKAWAGMKAKVSGGNGHRNNQLKEEGQEGRRRRKAENLKR